MCIILSLIDDVDDINDDFLYSQIDSRYFKVNEFNTLDFEQNSKLSIFHVNIASLNAHIDDLTILLARLKQPVDIIGISETKIIRDIDPSNNINIPGYTFVDEPTDSFFGGTGFYIKRDLDFEIRNDLKINSPGNHESCFVEIIFSNREKLILGCLYRHPSSEISVHDLSETHLEPVLQKINSEQKDCVFMGDFNLDLLRYHDKNDVSEFYDNFSSYFF